MGKNVSNIIARSTLSFLQDNGVNIDPIRTRCQLSQYEIEKNDGRISARQHQRFIRETAAYDFLWREQRLHGDERIIDGAYALFPELVGFCLNQPTAADAVEAYLRNRIIIGNCDSFTLRRDGDRLVVGYQDEAGLPSHDYSAIGNFILLRELVRLYAPSARLEIALSMEGGADRRRLDELFGCHCQFGQQANVIRFEGAELAAPAERYLPLLHRQQGQQLARKVAALEQDPGFSAMIFALLDEALANEKIGDEASCLDHVCAVVGMSRWTLNARLGQEEKNFSMILKMVRITRACALLAETSLSMQEISERLRFSSLSVFSRFFSTHLGSSPRHYRQRVSQHRE